MIDINTYSTLGIHQSLNHILQYVRVLTKSDAGTIYLKEKNYLKFMVFQNDSINENKFLSQNIDLEAIKLSLENNDKNLVAVSAFLNSKMINIEDVYQDIHYNFAGTKSFDILLQYKTHSLLTVPLFDPFNKTPIGVLQIINKKGANNLPSKFTKEDELFLEFIGGFVGLSIVNVQNSINNLKIENAQFQEKLAQDVEENSKKYVLSNHEYQTSQINKMLQNIAHQWRHPLGELSLNNIYLYQIIEDPKIQKIIEDNNQIIQNLSQTINSFAHIFEESNEKAFFDVSIWIEKGLHLIRDYIKTYKIEVKLSLENQVFLYGYASTFSQIILAILENAIDTFKKSNSGMIGVKSYQVNSEVVVEIEDTISTYIFQKSTIDLEVLQLLIQERFGGNLVYEFSEIGRKFILTFPTLQSLLKDKND